MVKLTEQKLFKGGSKNGQYMNEEMLNLSGHKGNALLSH
jgi:hypothetical protein